MPSAGRRPGRALDGAGPPSAASPPPPRTLRVAHRALTAAPSVEAPAVCSALGSRLYLELHRSSARADRSVSFLPFRAAEVETLQGEVTRPNQDLARCAPNPLRGDLGALALCPCKGLVGTAGVRGQRTLLDFELQDGVTEERAPVQIPEHVAETTIKFNSLPHPKN